MFTWSLGCTGSWIRSRRPSIDSAIRDDLVGVHVARCARARLKDIDRELCVRVTIDDLSSRRDPLRTSHVQELSSFAKQHDFTIPSA